MPSAWRNSLADDRRVIFTAPDEPGRITVEAALLDAGECLAAQYGETAADQIDRCSAIFSFTVIRRATVDQPERPAPKNPPGTIPETLTDSEGTAYAVFTPEDGGEFRVDGFSFSAGPGAIANNEFVGIAVHKVAAATGAGEAWHRFEFAGGSYAIDVVDSSGDAATDYILNEPAQVCLPLPHELRTNITKIAVTAFVESDGFTVLGTTIKINPEGIAACAAISSLPATVSVAAAKSPEAAGVPIETEEAVADDVLPDTGGTPAATVVILLLLLLGSVSMLSGLVTARHVVFRWVAERIHDANH